MRIAQRLKARLCVVVRYGTGSAATWVDTAFLIAPTAQHRFLFRLEDKQHLVFLSNKLALIGLGILAAAVCGALLLVSTKLFGTATGVVTAGIAAAAMGLLWFAMPVARRRKLARERALVDRPIAS